MVNIDKETQGFIMPIRLELSDYDYEQIEWEIKK